MKIFSSRAPREEATSYWTVGRSSGEIQESNALKEILKGALRVRLDEFPRRFFRSAGGFRRISES
jgi:hypothetical protein